MMVLCNDDVILEYGRRRSRLCNAAINKLIGK